MEVGVQAEINGIRRGIVVRSWKEGCTIGSGMVPGVEKLEAVYFRQSEELPFEHGVVVVVKAVILAHSAATAERDASGPKIGGWGEFLSGSKGLGWGIAQRS